jgi:hypothetical protein
VDNARAKARRCLGEAENQCSLSEEQQRQIAEIMAEAARHRPQ